jgi:type VI secretion system secreted protein Hcp
MAVDMFIKIDDVKGESVDKTHAGWIDVQSWNWGMTQSGSTHIAQGGGNGKVNVQDLTFTKNIDTSTPNLIKFCCSGNHFKQALLVVRKAGGTAPVEYLKVTMKNLIVSAISSGASGGGDAVTENITLNFGSFQLDYTPQDSGGKALAAITAQWNIAGNAET